MSQSTLTSKGQLTVPKSIREYLKIDTGDKIEFIIDETGHVIMNPKTLSVDDIFGMVVRKKGVSIEDMNNAILDIMQKKGKKEGSDVRNRH
jgi:AbrB family looped-hinge helix DNA binding protein